MISSVPTTVPPVSAASASRAPLVDVGDAEPGALGGGAAGEAGGDAARALDGDMEAGEAVLAERALHRRLDAQEDAVAGVRPGIAADRALGDGQAGDIFGLLRDRDHVGDVHPDILGGDVAAAQAGDRAAEGGEHLGRLGPGLVGEDHRLAAAQRQAGHGVLVAHPARQAQRVGDGVARLGIMPQAGAAGAGAEMGGMDGDDRFQAGLRVGDEMHELMLVEIGKIPKRVH